MKRRGVITTVRAPPLLAYQILLHTAQAFSADVLLVMGHDRLYAELCEIYNRRTIPTHQSWSSCRAREESSR